MTNYDLELARAVSPYKKWEATEHVVYSPGKMADEIFQPLDDHFPDVLAWLSKTGCVSLHGECIVGKELHVDLPAHDEEPLIITLDGTAEGIKQAVYEAAIRMIKGKVS